MAPVDIAPYDALLLVSFGGPEGPDDVLPFLRNVTRGRQIPPARLAEVAAHYQRFGGVSPINAANRTLRAAIRADLAAHGVELPVYWGNRNWTPTLPAVLDRMRAAGVRRALCFVTSAYASYSGCRQYRENLADAVAALAGPAGAPVLDKIRLYYDHPGFLGPFADGTAAALARLPPGSHVVFVTHSLPLTLARTSGPAGGAYVAQHRYAAERVVDAVARTLGRRPGWSLSYCSRSGPPSVPWLTPDVDDLLAELRAAGVPGVALVPIGFVSDHMEVVYDLDVAARAVADRVGLPVERVPTPGTDPRFVAMVRELLCERAAVERGAATAPAGPPGLGSWNACAAGCCPNPRGPRPAAAEAPVTL